MVAAASAQTVAYPLDILRRKLQINGTTERRDILAGTLKLFRDGGVRSMYAGFFPSLLKIIPAAVTSKIVREKMLHMLG